jgi:hemin uptake protein HemP
MTDCKLDVGDVKTAASVAGLPPGAPGDGTARVVVSSESLLRGMGQITIRHKNEIYVLRQTRFGKLILTK